MLLSLVSSAADFCSHSQIYCIFLPLLQRREVLCALIERYLETHKNQETGTKADYDVTRGQGTGAENESNV